MQKNKKTLISLISTLSLMSLFASRAQAQCAVCTVALVSGLGISRWLGVDDIYTGVWLGAAAVAVAGFAGNWVAKKWSQFKYAKWLTTSLILAIIAVALYFADGYVTATWAFTNLTQGIIIGIVCLLLGFYLDKALRRLKNDAGKPYFPFQKVVCPVIMVILGTLGAWILVG